MEKIGNLIPKFKTTLIHGRSGCGKTVSVLKYLKHYDVKPMFIDFDMNDELNSSKSLIHIDGYKLINELINNDVYSLFTNKVVIIDTYAKASLALESANLYDIHTFMSKFIDAGATVIVIAHTSYYSGKPSEPDVDTIFANHVACRLHLHNEVKKTKTDIYLEIEKLRGISSQIIKDWMRD